jgi:3-oxoacyl-[acyl-carrier-protein] synthase II
MSTRNDDPAAASRPFDAGRDGFVMGEASAVLLLEEWSRAVERDAPIYAELRGFGTTNDAYHMTRPRPDGSQARRAMELALADAGVAAGQVDHVNAHGSATPLNDVTEAKAVADLLGPRTGEVPVTGTKGYYGHALGASGALEAAICCLVLADGWIPPTLNLQEPDPECGLQLVTGEGLERRPSVVLSNSFGFGGINAALVLRRAPDGHSPGGENPAAGANGG